MSEETLAQRAARLEIERDGVSEMLKEAIHEKEEKVAHVQRLLVAARDERDELRKIVNVKRMVDRFLGWKLPENFNPDGGISFKRTRNENTPWPSKNEPVGTNLFDATQAEEMVRYMLADATVGVTQDSQQNPRQAHEEWERKLAAAQTEVASEMKKRLEGLFITLGIGDYPGDWWAAMEKMAEAIKAQKHLATLASERYDKILELERRLADAQGSVTEPPTEAEPRDDGPCDCDWVCVCPKG